MFLLESCVIEAWTATVGHFGCRESLRRNPGGWDFSLKLTVARWIHLGNWVFVHHNFRENSGVFQGFHLYPSPLHLLDYHEIAQVVDEIYDEFVAKKMGIDQKGQVCAAWIGQSFWVQRCSAMASCHCQERHGFSWVICPSWGTTLFQTWFKCVWPAAIKKYCWYLANLADHKSCIWYWLWFVPQLAEHWL